MPAKQPLPEGQCLNIQQSYMLELTSELLIGFEESADGQQIRCIACSAAEPNAEKHWILRASLKRHLLRDEHRRSSRLYHQKMSVSRKAERQQQALSQEFIPLTPMTFSTPLATPRYRAAVQEETSQAEKTMWQEYERNLEDTSLSAGIDPQQHDDQARARFLRQCDNLVFLDADEIGKVLGTTAEEQDDLQTRAALVQEEEALF